MQCNSGKEDADEMNITPSEHNGTKLDSKQSGMNTSIESMQEKSIFGVSSKYQISTWYIKISECTFEYLNISYE